MSAEAFSKAKQNLQNFWGYEAFRDGQDKAIASVLAGKNTVVLFPTGGGKSICYQLPATVFDGMTLVISPLVALMQDQVEQLKKRDISATFINSTLSQREVEQRLVNARNGMYTLLYCAPERLTTTLWEAEMERLNIAMVAVDEAHCISEWGHDFRPSYRNIRAALAPIADTVPWMALTATATPEVRNDIIHTLEFDEPTIITKGFERPNLQWWVLTGAKKDENLIRSVRKAAVKGSGIVYGGTRKNCERLATILQNRANITTAAYHAGIETGRRNRIQQEWTDGETAVVVATSAFGMGIDKANCRFVIHYTMPYSLEAYYQQAGRAGRDGAESYPLLLFSERDAVKARERIEQSYPSAEQLQQVYHAVCDSLDLAVGSEAEQLHEVPIKLLQKRAKLSAGTVRRSLKALRRLEVLEVVDHVSPQIGVVFTVNPDYVRERINTETNARKAMFLDTLYRQYGGASFDEMQFIDRDYVQQKLNTSPNGVIKGLQVLQDHDNLLRYEAIGEQPLMRPVVERQGTLRIDVQQLEDQRQNVLRKLDRMLGYIHTDGCREVFLRSYFGETNATPCGHCDRCRQRLNNTTETLSSEYIQQLKSVLEENPATLQELRANLRWPVDLLKHHLRYLERESKISVQENQFRWKA